MSLLTTRATLRQIFLDAARLPVVHFYTSNIDKFLQARLVFERFGLSLRHFPSTNDPYFEDYSSGKTRLLEKAVHEIRRTVGGSSIFFVEDTSVRIDALSSDGNDVPGLRIKEWFASMDYYVLDELLKSSGDNRNATVYSDIALSLPGLEEPVFFHGESRGHIVRSLVEFEQSPMYPWLSDQSFNAWFAPANREEPLGSMGLEESWIYDFRIRALEQLIERLEEYTAVLNLPLQTVVRRPIDRTPGQLSLFEAQGFTVIVVGPQCVGKTTFADYARARYDIPSFEASSVLRSFSDDYDPIELEGLSPFQFASRVLADYGADAAARRVLEIMEERGTVDAVISGFRTLEEVRLIKRQRPDALVVWLDASVRSRFERCIRRDRDNGPRTMESFVIEDRHQESLGLLKLLRHVADIRITNEGSLESFLRNVDRVMHSVSVGEPVKSGGGVLVSERQREDIERTQLFRSLAVLAESDVPLSAREIQEATQGAGMTIRANNVVRAFRETPELVRRDERSSVAVFSLRRAGRAYVDLMMQQLEQADRRSS